MTGLGCGLVGDVTHLLSIWQRGIPGVSTIARVSVASSSSPSVACRLWARQASTKPRAALVGLNTKVFDCSRIIRARPLRRLIE